MRGRATYLEHCVLCHGERADGKGPRREGFERPPRDFTNVAWRASISPSHVFLAVKNGVSGSAMPGWDVLGDDEIWDLTAYVLSVASPGAVQASR